MIKKYGHQKWWPADSPFEVMVGAVLTQNTAWTNVERAIDNLKAEHCLDAQCIVDLKQEKLAQLIRPSGYFNIKAKRLNNFCSWYISSQGYDRLKYLKTPELRRQLLSINGIGPETADDILLYAFHRRVFVVDAYTHRIFERLGVLEGGEAYEDVRQLFESTLKKQPVKVFNEYHALIVQHAKQACRKTPLCHECCLARLCDYERDN